jgi:hypothetical protein
MKPPTQVLGDLDWYTELRKPLLPFSGLFKKLGENVHFKSTSNLGEQGQRARIILLLCWVIGHRLPKDKMRQLVSTAVDDGFAAMQTDEHVDSLLQLHSVRGVLDQLANMIKTRLPLSKERNPFYGEDFVAEDEDKAIPRAELWAYREELGEGYVHIYLPIVMLKGCCPVCFRMKDMNSTSSTIHLFYYVLSQDVSSFHRQNCHF